jgi:hypothetical protein
VNSRNRSILVLLVALAVMALALGGCGSGEQDKAGLSAALAKVETAMAGFQQMGADSTVADIKAARDNIAPLWAEVVTAAKKVEGADPAAAEKAWTDLDTAVNGVAADATIIEAATAIMGPVQALIAIETELKTLVEPSEK